jgi:adenosylmethionine-8-amino-7-oxononanoate aminotransferase
VVQQASPDTSRLMVDFVQMKGFGDDPLILEEGRGIRVTDVFGKSYIDGLSGVFTVNLGHGIAELADVAAEQARKIAFTAPTMATNPRALELAELLIGITPEQYSTVKFFTGGSEATEAAIKLARQYWQQAGTPASTR